MVDLPITPGQESRASLLSQVQTIGHSGRSPERETRSSDERPRRRADDEPRPAAEGSRLSDEDLAAEIERLNLLLAVRHRVRLALAGVGDDARVELRDPDRGTVLRVLKRSEIGSLRGHFGSSGLLIDNRS